MACRAFPLRILFVASLLGCSGSSGPERLAIRGVVRLNGAVVDKGTFTLVPAGQTKGPSVGATISSAGTYLIDAQRGPSIGSYRVEIRSPQPTGKKINAPPPQPPGTLIDETAEGVPPRYNLESELRVDVVRDRGVYDFDLTSP